MPAVKLTTDELALRHLLVRLFRRSLSDPERKQAQRLVRKAKGEERLRPLALYVAYLLATT